MSGSPLAKTAPVGRLAIVPGRVVAITAVAALAACSDPHVANEATFRRAVEPLVRDRFCRVVDGVDRLQTAAAPASGEAPAWPLIVPASPSTASRQAGKLARAMLDEAAGAGLLDRRTETLSVRRVGYDEAASPRPVVLYRPTSEGAAIFRPVERETPSGIRVFPGACAGRAEVTEIVRWTEPTDALGATISQVTYRYRATDLTPLVPENERSAMEASKEATVTLVRASDGWRPAERR